MTSMPLGSGIRSGRQYLAGLEDEREVWLGGQRVANVTTHPGLARGAHTLAGFLVPDAALIDGEQPSIDQIKPQQGGFLRSAKRR